MVVRASGAIAAGDATSYAITTGGTLIAWGANFGPRTANREWWRLFTSVFLHTGLLHLLVNIIGLVQIGVILERLVGSVTFATVYLVAGGVSSAVSVSSPRSP